MHAWNMVGFERILDEDLPICRGSGFPGPCMPIGRCERLGEQQIIWPQVLGEARPLFVKAGKDQIAANLGSYGFELRIFPVPWAKTARIGYPSSPTLLVVLPTVILADEALVVAARHTCEQAVSMGAHVDEGAVVAI